VWVVLAILPLALCAVIATLVLGAIAGPVGGFFGQVKPEDLLVVQEDAERIAWPSGTPTRAPTATRTATRTVTPTGTPTTTPTAAAAVAPISTVSSHATYTPVVPNLPAGASTVPLVGNMYTGVKIYSRMTSQYMYQIVGRATDCTVDANYFTTNAAFLVRLPNGREEWMPEPKLVQYASGGNYVVPADDPALKPKQLTALTGCEY
jgi:hypothetical protein